MVLLGIAPFIFFLCVYFFFDRRYYLLGGLTSIFFLCALSLLFLDDSATDLLLTIGGLLNELLGSCLIMILFFFPLKRPQNWQKLRYPATALAAVIFSCQMTSWFQSLGDTSKIPYPRDSEGAISLVSAFQINKVIEEAPIGDLDVLIRVHQMSELTIIKIHILIGIICLISLVGKATWELAFTKKIARMTDSAP